MRNLTEPFDGSLSQRLMIFMGFAEGFTGTLSGEDEYRAVAIILGCTIPELMDAFNALERRGQAE